MTATATPATCFFCEKAVEEGDFCPSCEDKYHLIRSKEASEVLAKVRAHFIVPRKSLS